MKINYELRFTKGFVKELKKLDRYAGEMILLWINKNLRHTDNPRRMGSALKGNLEGKWRYRIGDYRLICLIEDNQLIILALNIGHRKDIYR